MHSERSGVSELKPAAPAVPAAADKQHNDNYDDEKRVRIHIPLLLAVPYVFRRFACALALQPTPFAPYAFP